MVARLSKMGRQIEQDSEIARLHHREMRVQWLIFHEDIYYQWKQKLLDDEIYRSWLADLEDVVQKHNLEV
ncbi:MAG: hypothetical protein K6T90_21145 [Leptolyngbyaceae cyanobacterium HOT.MB2.61]|nr:hypothetical protein [Leptolyngbyaceae cyanobacterium HOT.MB2.61]